MLVPMAAGAVAVSAPRRRALSPAGPTYSNVPEPIWRTVPAPIGLLLGAEKSALRRPPPTKVVWLVLLRPVRVVAPEPIWKIWPGPLNVLATDMSEDLKKKRRAAAVALLKKTSPAGSEPVAPPAPITSWPRPP